MATSGTTAQPAAGPLSPEELRLIDAYWRAANYLSVGQIYLLDNPLLRRPLEATDVKPRLLGHWGTTPGLNMIYAHMNREIRARDLDCIYIIGPGHGGPAIVANTYLEGTYTEIYPSITRDEDGAERHALDHQRLDDGNDAGGVGVHRNAGEHDGWHRPPGVAVHDLRHRAGRHIAVDHRADGDADDDPRPDPEHDVTNGLDASLETIDGADTR